jgi:hypothetical protein
MDEKKIYGEGEEGRGGKKRGEGLKSKGKISKPR